MASSLNIYTHLKLSELEQMVKSHQEEFEELLIDSFTDSELEAFEGQLEHIAAIYVQPMISELNFDDFYVHEIDSSELERFFDQCKTSVVLENLPYLQNNPFQVSYLRLLLGKLEEVIIDKGGLSELTFKSPFVKELIKHKGMESFMSPRFQVKETAVTSKPVHPIDFLIHDVYKERDRLELAGKMETVSRMMESQSEKQNKVFSAIKEEKLEAGALLRKSGLIAKDFDDHLEKLKFFLRKIQ